MAHNGTDRPMAVSEVAHYLRVSVPTIWRWLREGKLKGMKIGNARRFRMTEIVRFEADTYMGDSEQASMYTVYDVAYVALAELTDNRLYTCDDTLISSLGGESDMIANPLEDDHTEH